MYSYNNKLNTEFAQWIQLEHIAARAALNSLNPQLGSIGVGNSNAADRTANNYPTGWPSDSSTKTHHPPGHAKSSFRVKAKHSKGFSCGGDFQNTGLESGIMQLLFLFMFFFNVFPQRDLYTNFP